MDAPPPSETCPKCQSSMEFGLLVDATHQQGMSFFRGPEQVLPWVRGTPGKSWWNLSFSTPESDRLQVATLRCTACGFVELYAPQA